MHIEHRIALTKQADFLVMASCCLFKAVIITPDQDVIDYSLYTFQS